MVDAIVVHWSIWVIDPVLGRLEVVSGPVPLADNGGDLWRLGEEEDPLSIAAADEEVGYKGGGEEDKEREGPDLGHGDRRREEGGISSDGDVM